MKNTILLFLLLITCPALHAQELHLDSLYREACRKQTAKSYLEVCETISKAKTVVRDSVLYLKCLNAAHGKLKANASDNALYHQMVGRWEESLQHFEAFKKSMHHALDLLGKNGDPERKARICNSMGSYYLTRNPDSAAIWLKKGIACISDKECEALASLYNDLAIASFYRGDVKEAALCLKKVVPILEAEHNDIALCSVYSSIASVYANENKRDSAFIYYQMAINKCDATKNHMRKTTILCNMASLYNGMKRFDEALKYASSALHEAQTGESRETLYYAYHIRAAVYRNMGREEEAVADARLALAMAEKDHSPQFYVRCAPTLMMAYHALNRQDSIDYYAKECEKNIKLLPPISQQVLHYYEVIGLICHERGQWAKSQVAYQHLIDALPTITLLPKEELYTMTSKNYAGLKDYRKAYFYLDSARVMKDSLQRQEISKQMSDFAVKYETKEKEVEIMKLQQEQLRQKSSNLRLTILLIILLFMILLVIVSFLNNKRMQRIKATRQKKETDLQLAHARIEGLERERKRIAMDLHDGVCNELLGIQFLLQADSPPDTEALLKLLETSRSNVRSISHELMPPSFQYANLKEILQDYILHLPRPDDMAIHYQATPATEWNVLDNTVSYELYRIAQEVMGNIVKYAKATDMYVKLIADGECRLMLEIADNGLPWEAPAEAEGIGLQTINDRLTSIHGEYRKERIDGMNRIQIVLPQAAKLQ